MLSSSSSLFASLFAIVEDEVPFSISVMGYFGIYYISPLFRHNCRALNAFLDTDCRLKEFIF
jgi:hypothetical protein